MKGVIFNLLEDAVTDRHGAEAWDSLLDMAGLDGAWTSIGSYPDAQLVKLVDTAAVLLGQPPNAILNWFGRAAMPMLAQRYSALFTPHSGARGFILSVNDAIHPEVRKLYEGAVCPHFHFGQGADGLLTIGYQSPRRLCHLAHGFIEGAADHFGEQVAIEHVACMLDGSPFCRLTVSGLR